MKDEIRNVVYIGILILFAVMVGGIVWHDSQKEPASSEMFVRKQVILIHEKENQKKPELETIKRAAE